MKHSILRRLFATVAAVLAAHPLALVQASPLPAPYRSAASAVLPDEIGQSRRNAITKAVAVCSPAIVGINVTETRTQVYQDPFSDFFADPMFEQFFGNRRRNYQRNYEVRSLGSGFLISADGYIVTNDHVAGGATKIVVTLTDGSKHNAKIIGTDLVSDVTVLKIEGSGFPHLKLGSSDDLAVGSGPLPLAIRLVFSITTLSPPSRSGLFPMLASASRNPPRLEKHASIAI